MLSCAVPTAGCKCTNYDVHLLGAKPRTEHVRMAVNVLLLDDAQKKELEEFLHRQTVADWFNPTGSTGNPLKEDWEAKGFLSEITFETATTEVVETMPAKGRQGLWACVLANPAYDVTQASEWEHFHAARLTSAKRCDVYFGLHKLGVYPLEDKQARKNWRE
jgi:hypothetical protein